MTRPISGLLTTVRLAAHSIVLLSRRSSAAARLGATVTRKYGEPVELEEYRREALAGPGAAQTRMLDDHLKPGAAVVDIGCAAGRFCLETQARGHRVVGVDLVEAMVREASALARGRATSIPFCVMDARALGLRDGSLDTALMLGSVVSHIPVRRARLATLGEAWRVLRPGGVLLIETQSRASSRRYRAYFLMMTWLRWALDLVRRPPVWEVGDRLGAQVSGAGPGSSVYMHMYAPDELERDLREAGFEPTSVDTSLYLMRFVAVKR